MTEITKETITTQANSQGQEISSSAQTDATGSQTFEYLIYFFFGLLEILLAFRLVLKLAGANFGGAFVSMVYGVTRIFILPFEGIFKRGFARGAETTSVFEPSTLVAIIVYAFAAWGVVKLVRILSGKQQTA